MRPISLALAPALVLVLAGCGKPGSSAQPREQTLTRKSAVDVGILNANPLWTSSDFQAEEASKYYNIDVSRNLFINDSAVWAGQPFSLALMLHQAATIVDASDTGSAQAASDWRKSAQSIMGNAYSSDAPLLAVANRLDLAFGTRGAEVHFVYGADPMRYILEFEIDPASVTLNSLAAQWMNLDGTGAKLAALVSGLKFRTARIRAVYDAAGAGWALAEWDFSPGTKVVPSSLGDLIDSNCVPVGTAALPSGQNCVPWAQIWATLNAQQTPDPNIVFAGPFEMTTQYLPQFFLPPGGSQSMDIPGNMAISREDVRHILALRQCRYCHGRETGTTFTHVNPPVQGSLSQLSNFLTGSSSGTAPSLPPFSRLATPTEDTPGYFNVSVAFQAPSTPTVTPPASLCSASGGAYCVIEPYNELARRAKNMSAYLLTEIAGHNIDPADFAKFQLELAGYYATRTVH